MTVYARLLYIAHRTKLLRGRGNGLRARLVLVIGIHLFDKLKVDVAEGGNKTKGAGELC